tara:strand:- start:670 stop:1287 length:618 start_codon:yes stop_codon:yes gene_type:complete
MGRRPKTEEQSEATEEQIENSVEVNEVEPVKEEEPLEKPKRPKREKSPAQIAAWAKLQEVNKKKFEERRAAKERGEVVVPHGRNIDKQSKQVLEKLDKPQLPKKEIKQEVEEEEEIEYVKAPPKKVKKKKKKIVIEQDSSSSDEEIVISRRRSKKKITPKPTSPIPIPQETAKDEPIEKEKPVSNKPPQEERKYTPQEILRGLGL